LIILILANIWEAKETGMLCDFFSRLMPATWLVSGWRLYLPLGLTAPWHLTAAKVFVDSRDEALLRFRRFDGNDKFVKYLVFKGALINVQDEFGCTPLHYAAESCCECIDAVKFLVYNGADVNAKNKHGKIPLDLAREKGNTAVVKFLSLYTADRAIADSETPHSTLL
jgi:ankyrin repeat protein